MKASKLAAVLLVVATLLLPQNAPSQSSEQDKRTEITLTADNTIVLNDEVTGETVAKVVEQARKLDNQFSFKAKFGKKEPIYLFLNTPGGSIQAGLELIEQLQALKRPVYPIVLFAASMGFQITQALGERYILNNGVLMSHRAFGGFEGEFGGQAPSQIDSRYSLWMDRLNEMDAQTVKRTNGKQTLESYQKAYASELWRTGSKSVAEGYADKTAKVNCDSSLEGFETREALFMGIIPVKYDLSRCPMNTEPLNIRINIRTNRGVKTFEEFTELSGGFGFACLQALAKDPTQLCATDIQLTLETVYQAVQNFKKEYISKQRQVVYMRLGY
jgi:ATP-dependent Clp protease protease subunit